MTKFEELLAKYGKTAEDITFDYAEMSDEELEAKFAELFADAGTNEPVADDPQKFAKLVRTYEISHEDIRYALYQLLESLSPVTTSGISSTLFMMIISHMRIGMATRSTVRTIQRTVTTSRSMEKDLRCTASF